MSKYAFTDDMRGPEPWGEDYAACSEALIVACVEWCEANPLLPCAPWSYRDFNAAFCAKNGVIFSRIALRPGGAEAIKELKEGAHSAARYVTEHGWEAYCVERRRLKPLEEAFLSNREEMFTPLWPPEGKNQP